jgi:hydroxymethylpyrimidine kinase/phosphomethylpyrimidine kinase
MKRVVTIAGSDSGGGAGIQADLKTITVLGCFGMSVVTALTAQNTVGVQGIHQVPVEFIEEQFDSVMSDIGADSAKTGMLATPEIIRTVSVKIREYAVDTLVVDPVMVARSGDMLVTAEAKKSIAGELLPLALVTTPNIKEAEELSGIKIASLKDMEKAAGIIHSLGPGNVIVKNFPDDNLSIDVLYDGRGYEFITTEKVDTADTHGTGCTYSAALASMLAAGKAVKEAAVEAKEFVVTALKTGVKIGSGHGPVNHFNIDYILRKYGE